MTYKVIISEAAKIEFKEIHGFIKLRYGKEAAGSFKVSFSQLIKQLRKYPFTYPQEPKMTGIRKCAALTPTVVFYEVMGNLVTIHRIRDGRSLS